MLFGAIEVHGPSTDSLTAEATWTDRVDDLSLPKWQDLQSSAIAFRTHVRPYEDVALLANADAEAVLPTSARSAHTTRGTNSATPATGASTIASARPPASASTSGPSCSPPPTAILSTTVRA